MTDLEKEHIVAAVKRLFAKIRQGKVRFTKDVPQTVQQLKAVRFDDHGNPIYETIGPLVHAMVLMTASQRLDEREAKERKRNSPVHQMLGPPVTVTDEILQDCVTKASFSPLAFELYKEVATMMSICSHMHTEPGPEDPLLRNQAICAGLLVRITKFMIAVASLVSQDAERGDVVFALNRSITESSTDLRFLATKNEERHFDQFVAAGLSSERELHDVIRKNINERGGDALPIEKRMLAAIDRVCRISGVAIEDIEPKLHNWAGGLRNRLMALGEGDTYPMLQRSPSSAVHGTWIDLIQRHLKAVDGGGFRPDPSWSHVDSRLLLPPGVLALHAARTYVEVFFPPLPELEPWMERHADLLERISKVEEMHEAWINRDKSDDGSS